MERESRLARLGTEQFDVLVIGGGVTGAGIAWDAALRGFSVALVEKDDFASGTSSRSSKLLHGGLRYLKHLDVRIVRQGLRERASNEWMAPHLITKTRFVVPRYDSHRLGIRAGLLAYDVLSLGSHYPRHHRLSAASVLELAPGLRPDVDGGLEYWDATIDDARLVWTIVRSSEDAGVVALNHVAAVALIRNGHEVRGARVRDAENSSELEVRARVVVNATGVWADDIRRFESPDAPVEIRPSKGAHLVFRRSRVPIDTALLLPTRDKRFVFVVPWEDGCVHVGTTDKFYDGDLDDPHAENEEIDYLIGALNDVLDRPVGREDIVSTFAGLRALVARKGRSKDISRRHLIEAGPGGMVTIAGGKLTAWRPMAVDAVDAAIKAGGLPEQPTKTAKARLAGAALLEGVVPALEAVLGDLGLESSHAPRLYHRYGALASEVLRLVRDDLSLGETLHPQVPYLRAEAEYAIRSESARTVDDVLARRLRTTLTTTDGGAAAGAWVAGRLRALS